MPSRYRKTLNPHTGRYVYKHGRVAHSIRSSRRRRSRRSRSRSRSPRRSVVVISVVRSPPRRKRSGVRQSPSASATLFAVGTVREGNDRNLWRIKRVAHGIKRWVRA